MYMCLFLIDMSLMTLHASVYTSISRVSSVYPSCVYRVSIVCLSCIYPLRGTTCLNNDKETPPPPSKVHVYLCVHVWRVAAPTHQGEETR